MRIRHERDLKLVHSTSFVRERLDDQLLVFFPPLLHLSIRTNNRVDVVNNVLLLSTFVVKRYAVGWRCQGFKDISDVNLRPARDAKT